MFRTGPNCAALAGVYLPTFLDREVCFVDLERWDR